jgi:hypothetical protein
MMEALQTTGALPLPSAVLRAPNLARPGTVLFRSSAANDNFDDDPPPCAAAPIPRPPPRDGLGDAEGGAQSFALRAGRRF